MSDPSRPFMEPFAPQIGRPLLILTRWAAFAQEWRTAEPSRRMVLSDGRPGILSERSGSVLTLPDPVWQLVKRGFRDQLQQEPPRKRTRRCEACGADLERAREFEWAWTFVCRRCQSTEVWGKDRVGGTVGAGEREPDGGGV